MAFRNDNSPFEVSTPPFSRMKMMGALPFVFDAGPEPTQLGGDQCACRAARRIVAREAVFDIGVGECCGEFNCVWPALIAKRSDTMINDVPGKSNRVRRLRRDQGHASSSGEDPLRASRSLSRSSR